MRLSTTTASTQYLLAEPSHHPQEQTEQFIPLGTIDVDGSRARSSHSTDRRSFESNQNDNESETPDNFEQGTQTDQIPKNTLDNQ
ncbi:hypothetical protein V494_02013 [Pseudogymnoascus sp. VKM F-4513 (FW-928)]|nr:hypothetical protein V494_02013 [Pseudogymnoascus sp. VKM F-4513 (FW-928)]